MRRPSGALWSHPDFVKLWTGQSISELGSQVSQLAIPWLAAVELHASPLAFSLLGVLGFLPFVLFALPAGVWVERQEAERSEEHTSELQSQSNLVCRLLLEKKKKRNEKALSKGTP